MQAQVGDLCFTPDGLAAKGVLLRHLVMPGYEEEGKQIIRWLSENVSRDLYIHVMEQYHPRAHVGKAKRTTGRSGRADLAADLVEPEEKREKVRYAEINRSVSIHEVDSVKALAQSLGLRVLDVAEHGGFNI
jgi:putative pyruvate formate lyase activating enzyme